jgi:two-component system nitrogen regulation sensor histidine kinase NtrY
LLRNILFIILSVVFFAASLVIYRYFIYSKQEINYEKIENSINRDVQKELSELVHISDDLVRVVPNDKKLSFYRLLATFKSNYPYFIFRNKQLIFWSDYKIVPGYESISGSYDFKYLYIKNGKFIVHKSQVIKEDKEYEIIFLMPLSFKYAIENNYVVSGINKKLLHFDNLHINNEYTEDGINIFTPAGSYLFSVSFPASENIKNTNALVCLLAFFLLSVFCLAVYTVKWISYLLRHNRPGLGLLLLLTVLLLIRSTMLGFNFPFSVIEWDLFNSKYFASSSISPSLGDFFLNLLFFTIFSFFFFYAYYRTALFKKLIFKSAKSFYISLVCGSLSFYFLFLVYHVLAIINLHSQWTLDINFSIDFNLFRVISIFIFVMASLNYFIFLHVLARVFIFFNGYHWKKLIFFLLAGGVVYSALALAFQVFYWPVVLINIIFFFSIIQLRLPKYLKTFRYATYVYFLSAAGVCAGIGALAIYRLNFEKVIIQKNKFASQILVESDVLGEYLLSEVHDKIEKDEFIKAKFTSIFSSKDLIEHKIKRIFLSNYFERYDVQVSMYDPQGYAYNPNDEFQEYRQAAEALVSRNHKTEYKDVFFLNEIDKKGLRRYVVFNKIVKNGHTIGFILIQLTNKKIIPNSVYPELLVDKKFGQATEGRNYSFAIYNDQELILNSGTVNYERDFQNSWLEDERFYNQGMMKEGFHHLGIRGTDKKVLVVSSEKYTLIQLFSNFSFLFVVFILFVLLLLGGFAIYFKLKKIDINYTTKIQVYLNIAFFLPLFIVSITTFSIISSSYTENLHKSFIKKAESISNNLSAYLEDDRSSKIRIENLQNILFQMARYTETDINLFGNDGRLLFSSQPLIYEHALLSGLINPAAYSEIKEGRKNTVMLSESVGKLNYNSAYVGVRSYDTGRLSGILSIPFFESKQEVEKQFTDVLTTILNIFISIFLFFLILSYFASRVLTIPLKLITQRIKKITLGGDNESIEWGTKDEIGLLVGEYNKMLIKLEQSKEALSKNEKESAWREMAQQIAHEIKNPLTPMKLTIQHLQRGMEEQIPSFTEKIEKGLQTLLTQVNNLNEIATSFSLFAKMPAPRREEVDITLVLQSTISLYNRTEAEIISELDTQKLSITGDLQSMSSIFSNIIINAIQSVPNDRKPFILVRSYRKKNMVMVEIRDNGTGIPESIQNKIFLPHFSTKYAGSGIGLALAKQWVEYAGGNIWFESRQGEGTVFYVALPLFIK